MSRIVAQLLILLTVTLSVANAQCFTVCSLKPCAEGTSLPPSPGESPSCHHKNAPKAPAHDEHNQGCAHEMLWESPSEEAAAPLQSSALVGIAEPVHVSSFTWASAVEAAFAVEPSPPPNGGIVSITVLRI